MKYIVLVLTLLSLTFAGTNPAAFGQDMPHPLAYEQEANYKTQSTGPLYKLTPDKIKILELGEPAASTIIGNEQHLDIFFDTSNRAALVPREPGTSHFQILNDQGQTIASGHAIIASPKPDYMRIRRACDSGIEDCQNLSVYFCPGLCHDIRLPSQTANNNQTAGQAGTQGVNIGNQ